VRAGGGAEPPANVQAGDRRLGLDPDRPHPRPRVETDDDTTPTTKHDDTRDRAGID
jgi:hypothetical protein